MRLLASALCLAACLVPIKAFVPWRPDVSDLDPATLHAIKPPPPAALRRHNLQISRAAAKFTRRAHASTTSNSRPVARPVAPLARREDKTSGPIGLSSDPNDISYWVNVDFGSSQKSFRLVLDTGSADTWVPSSECIAQSCLAHRTYGPGDSSTLTFTDNKTFSIKYASGNVEGSIVNDSLSLGPVTLENVSFGLATVVSDDFTAFPVDGILGLGFPSASVQKVPTFLDNLISQQIITKRVFGVHLHRSSDAAGNGSVIFGGIDSSRIEGGPTALKYYSLNTTSHLWSIRLSDVLIDGKSAGFEEGRNVVIDTGTALVLIPPDDALKLHQPISGTRSNGQTFYIPCNTNVRLKLRFGSDEYEISPKDYVGDVVDAGNNLCLSLIVGRSVVREGAWLLGDVFLRNVYSVFDMDSDRIGFGKVAPGPYSTRTSTTTSPLPQTALTVYDLPTITRTITRSGLLHSSVPSNTVPTLKTTGEFDRTQPTSTVSAEAATTTSAGAATQTTSNMSPDRYIPGIYTILFSSLLTFLLPHI